MAKKRMEAVYASVLWWSLLIVVVVMAFALHR